ncbi:ribosomal protein L17 [Microdochium bolleyi]|uniref:Large ribosomal subunit protein bL17m n=1 Tax=Microdochium bolleyi TaxID=196109 RepID=A0A136J249_9PEZI|nr:ribosomal protein L17 [Microdochium bolleyi]
MAGGLVKYRHLSRNSAHRQALLRNLVTSLIKHESIQTSYAKAKEAQRLAEKLITLAKRNNEATLRKATGILYTPHQLLPRLFNNLRDRYAERPGGYTRVLRTMPKSTYDQADSAILQLVDGPRDLRFAMTAAAVARDQKLGKESQPLTLLNKQKVTRFRKNGPAAFDKMVARMAEIDLGRDTDAANGKTKAPSSPASKKGRGVVPAIDPEVAAAAVEGGTSKPSVLR